MSGKCSNGVLCGQESETPHLMRVNLNNVRRTRNMKRTVYVAMAVVVLLAICTIFATTRSGVSHKAVTVPEISAREREDLGLPLPDQLTLATQEDMNNVNAIDADIRQAISLCIPDNTKWQVYACRDTGQFMLLWIGFPDVMDGGIDLVYSKKTKSIICSFLGGYRG